jgi:SAM-dependent methyltransferase
MSLSLQEWHHRYQQQARWTHSLRDYAYRRASINTNSKVLEVGCGTGIILDELVHQPVQAVFGMDIDRNSVVYLQENFPQVPGIVGDALNIPCKNNTFDACICHFLLLWVVDPLRAVSEMARVTRPGGYVLILAEPDYGGRIDYPDELSQVGAWQIKSLQVQGANPFIGRELRSLCEWSSLANIEVGVLGGQWKGVENQDEIDLEWQVIRYDLQQIGITEAESSALQMLDNNSRASNQRVLFVPTFYALGQVLD